MNRPGKLTRREFLARSTAVSVGLASPAFPALMWGRNGAPPPSERVTVGLIGHGMMGQGHLHRLAGDSKFQVLAVCDVDRIRREQGQKVVESTYATQMAGGTYRGCAVYNDYREMLGRSDIDAVVIVTPDHWHALQAVDAAKAGKDIYCEKPISLTIQEGRRVVETVRRYGRVFQTGTQYRSISAIRTICQFIRQGGLGRVKAVFALWSNLGMLSHARFKKHERVLNAGKTAGCYVPMDFPLPSEPVPEGLDWEMWVGPAPWRPYNAAYHYNPPTEVVPWAFCDAFGVASSTWHASHAADVIQYALGMENSGPVEIIHPNAGQFPTMTCRYSNGTLLHFVDHWGVVKSVYKAVPAEARLEGLFGGVIVGERGWITTMSSGGQVEGEPESLFEEIGLPHREVNIGGNNHHANWLECIRTRQAPSADEQIGHCSATLCHLIHIAHWTGKSLNWDPAKEVFIGCEAANRLRSRAMRAPWCI